MFHGAVGSGQIDSSVTILQRFDRLSTV